MDSLVLELQKEAMNNKIQVSVLLKKAKAVAVKLQRKDINEWIQNEIQGYAGYTSLPEYRKLWGEIQSWAFKNNRWKSANFKDAEFKLQASRMELFQSMTEIESILDQVPVNKYERIVFIMSHAKLKEINNTGKCSPLGENTCWQIERGQILSVLESVRNKILDWSLELEGQGIVGEGMTFSNKEVRNATAVTFNINNSNVTGIGSLNSSITTRDDHSTSSTIEAGDYSTILSNMDIKDYSQIYLELKEKDVPDYAVKELKEAIDLLQKGDAKDKESALKKGKAFIKKYGPTIGMGALAILIKDIFAG